MLDLLLPCIEVACGELLYLGREGFRVHDDVRGESNKSFNEDDKYVFVGCVEYRIP